MIRLTGVDVVTPDGVLRDVEVCVDGERIASVGAAGAERGEDTAGHWIVPGFVDIHVHGGGGATFTTGEVSPARAVAGFHLRHGTTTLLASLVTAPAELLAGAVRAYAPLVGEGVIAGVHLEGPYLSRARCGAQNPRYLQEPSIAELSALLAAGPVRMVTLAPELPGALDAIALLAGQGVVAAIGHTDATYDQTLAGIAAGATVGTHVFNGMRPPHHREPGPVYALLDAPSVACELIADGVHLHDGTLGFAAHVAGSDRTVLVTDAMAAAGMGDGEYELGGRRVAVRAGAARLAGTDTIAGSTLTMDAALRRAVGAGLSIVDAARMASTNPARVLGLGDRGALEPGLRADLVVLDADLTVRRVMRAGAWV